MAENQKVYCPECDEQDVAVFDRRAFIRVLGEHAAVLAGVSALAAGAPGLLRAADAAKIDSKPARPAEALVKELFAGLSTEQKTDVLLPWDHGTSNGKGLATRLRMYNGPIGKKKIGETYTKPQIELIDRIVKTISNGEDGYRQISRGGTWDGSGSLQGCGATLFGDPADGKKYAFVFTGHHLTVRCDGDSEEGAAFGGPMYYGHSPNGYSDKNIFFYQTKSVISVYDALSEDQRKKAEAPGNPGEHEPSVQFRKMHPGLAFAELSKDQRELVEKVMRTILSPYRKEDADEVMQILKTNGGLEKLHLAFYKDGQMNDKQPWHFWRLEGPGFVWNYRVLPHVHTYVNISSKV